MQNIVSNAIKYRKPNQIAKVLIQVDGMEQGGVRISIVDNGIGFEAKYATMVFEPFKRLHSKAKYPGTGIKSPFANRLPTAMVGTCLSVRTRPRRDILHRHA